MILCCGTLTTTEQSKEELEMISTEIDGGRGDHHIRNTGSWIVVPFPSQTFDIPTQNASFTRKSGKREIEDLIAMSLLAVGIDIDCHGYYRQQHLMFNEILLVKQFIEDICFLQLDKI